MSMTTRMTPSEAFVETLVAHGVTTVFGIAGSAYMDAMDLFPPFSEVAGAALPKGRVYDGESLLSLLNGRGLQRSPEEPFYYYNCENLQAVRIGDWKVHLTRQQKQIPFWDKAKNFTRLKQPVLYNLRDDRGESRDLAQANPEVIKQALRLAGAIRQELGEFMERGKAQRPTGSIYPKAPVISHEKDWGLVPSSVVKVLNAERSKRHPNWKAKTKKK